MLNNLASFFDTFAGRMIAGALTLPAEHPVLAALLLAGVAGATGAVWIDLIGLEIGGSRRTAETERTDGCGR